MPWILFSIILRGAISFWMDPVDIVELGPFVSGVKHPNTTGWGTTDPCQSTGKLGGKFSVLDSVLMAQFDWLNSLDIAKSR